MFTPASALLWEIRRSLRWRFWLTLFTLLLFPMLTILFTLVDRSRGNIWTWELTPMAAPNQMILTMVNLALSALLIGHAIGMPSRQFSLPVSSRTLAAVRLLPGAVACAALYLLVALTLNVLLRAGWPYFGPAVTYGVGYMLMYAAVYRFRGNDHRMGVAGLAVMTLLIFWMGSHHGPRWWKEPSTVWSDLTATELTILLAAGGLAWTSVVATLASDRRGAGWGHRAHATSEADIIASRSRRPARKFGSPVFALFWQEWRQDGWLLPGVIGGLMIVLALIHIGGLTYCAIRGIPIQPDNRSISLALGTTFCYVCAAAPWFMGLSGQHGKQTVRQSNLSTAQATLPISDAALGWVIMARGLASAMIAAVFVILVSIAWTAAVEVFLNSSFASEYQFPGDTWRSLTLQDVSRGIGFFFLTLWLTTGFSTAATLTGRWWLATIPICIVPAWILVLCLSSMLDYTHRELMLTSVIYVVLATSLVGTAVAYVLGIAYDIIRIRTLLFGFALFVFTEWLGIWFIRYQSSIQVGYFSPPFGNILIMLFALTVAPSALIPLAAYYNRHR